MDYTNLFNVSLELGGWISSTTQHFTGSPFLTLLIIVCILFLFAGFFHMPETVYLIPLLPFFIVLAVADPGMKILLAIVSLFFAYVFYTIIPIK